MNNQGKGFAFVLKNVRFPLKGGLFTVHVDHYGIYDGNGTIIHNAPPNGVHTVPFDNYLLNVLDTTGCQTIQDVISKAVREDKLVLTQPNPGNADLIVERATSLIGTAYDKVSFNCEHFARYCFEGVSRSTQVQKAALIGGGVAAAGGLLWWLTRGRR